MGACGLRCASLAWWVGASAPAGFTSFHLHRHAPGLRWLGCRVRCLSTLEICHVPSFRCCPHGPACRHVGGAGLAGCCVGPQAQAPWRACPGAVDSSPVQPCRLAVSPVRAGGGAWWHHHGRLRARRCAVRRRGCLTLTRVCSWPFCGSGRTGRRLSCGGPVVRGAGLSSLAARCGWDPAPPTALLPDLLRSEGAPMMVPCGKKAPSAGDAGIRTFVSLSCARLTPRSACSGTIPAAALGSWWR